MFASPGPPAAGPAPRGRHGRGAIRPRRFVEGDGARHGTACRGSGPRARARPTDRGTPAAAARRPATARLARPSAGAAVTRTRSTSPCQPAISSREARGWTRTGSSAPATRPALRLTPPVQLPPGTRASPGRGKRLVGAGGQVLLEETLIDLDGGPEGLGQPPPVALEGPTSPRASAARTRLPPTASASRTSTEDALVALAEAKLDAGDVAAARAAATQVLARDPLREEAHSVLIAAYGRRAARALRSFASTAVSACSLDGVRRSAPLPETDATYRTALASTIRRSKDRAAAMAADPTARGPTARVRSLDAGPGSCRQAP